MVGTLASPVLARCLHQEASEASHTRHRAPLTKTQRRRPSICTVCAADCGKVEAEPRRRDLVLGLGAAVLGSAIPQEARADGALVEAAPNYSLFLGKGGPPTSYGGYGGNAKETARYSFEYPTQWKRLTVGKVEKGMQGIDARVANPKTKAEGAFVVTFGREGEDNKKFKLGDADLTLQGFAGADSDLQDALTVATKKNSYTREVDDRKWYNFEVNGPELNYLATITLDEGKVFALFAKSPTKLYRGHEATFQHILNSFRINAVVRY